MAENKENLPVLPQEENTQLSVPDIFKRFDLLFEDMHQRMFGDKWGLIPFESFSPFSGKFDEIFKRQGDMFKGFFEDPEGWFEARTNAWKKEFGDAKQDPSAEVIEKEGELPDGGHYWLGGIRRQSPQESSSLPEPKSSEPPLVEGVSFVPNRRLPVALV